jgi:uncharacterized hydantoinase/oxoprolinase family protein
MGSDPLGRNDDWVASKEHDILVASTLARLQAQGLNTDEANVTMTLGVPSRVFRARSDLVKAIVQNTHKACASRGFNARIFVHAQPLGVVASHTLMDTGHTKASANIDEDSFAVVDVGQFTTDLCAVVKGEPIIEATESCEGLEILVNHVRSRLREKGFGLGSVDIKTILDNPKIKIAGEIIDVSPWITEAIHDALLPKIINTIRDTFNPILLQTVDSVLIAGGGAPIVFNELKSDSRLRHAKLVDDHRWAIADGFARLSALLHESSKTNV